MTINDLPVGRSVDETMRLVQAFQHADQHGEGELSPMHTPLEGGDRTQGYWFSSLPIPLPHTKTWGEGEVS